jgi:hypothetical protein
MESGASSPHWMHPSLVAAIISSIVCRLARTCFEFGCSLLEAHCLPGFHRRPEGHGGEFNSVDHLAERIIEFINGNRRAAPFRLTYEGRSLKAAKAQ